MDHIKFIHCADLHIDSPFKGISNVNSLESRDLQSVQTRIVGMWFKPSTAR